MPETNKSAICLTVPFFLLICLIFAVSGCALHDKDKTPCGIKPSENPDLKKVLETSGKNKRELINFVQKYPTDSAKASDAEFLAANLPPCDRASMSSENLREIVDYAHLARRTLPWGESIPRKIFRHFVLPHRVSQEPFQPHRARFYSQLAPIVANCTAKQAVDRVNRWCMRKMTFKKTSRWDQGPLTSIKRGFGRCEEAVILSVLALRAVGIPARSSGTPAWKHSDDNHVWTEVWIKGKWHPLEAAQPYREITANIKKAPLVRSVVYGKYPFADKKTISRDSGSSVINLTADYTPAWTLNASLLGKDGKPIRNHDLYISVFNYACFRPVARIKTDNKGQARIELGQGTFLLSAAKDAQYAYSLLTNLNPGKEKKISVSLQLDSGPDSKIFSGKKFLPFHSGDTQNQTAGNSLITPFPALKNIKNKQEDNKIRTRRFKGLDTLSGRFLSAYRISEKYSSRLKKTRGNFLQIAPVLTDYKNRQKKLTYLNGLAAKDLVDLSNKQAAKGPNLAAKSRYTAQKSGLTYPDEVFENFVLSPRVEYEPLSFWRPRLFTEFAPPNMEDPFAAAAKINRYTARIPRIKRGFFGSRMTPEQVIRAGAGTKRAKKILACSALRSLGIPSRYNPELEFPEFYADKKWNPFFVQRPESLGLRNATKESRTYYGPIAKIEVQFEKKGEKLTGDKIQYFKDFSIAEYANKGYFRTIEQSLAGNFPDNSTFCSLTLSPGDYWLFATSRNKKGEPEVVSVPFKARGGKILKMTVSYP